MSALPPDNGSDLLFGLIVVSCMCIFVYLLAMLILGV